MKLHNLVTWSTFTNQVDHQSGTEQSTFIIRRKTNKIKNGYLGHAVYRLAEGVEEIITVITLLK